VLLYASLNTLLLILISSNLSTESALFPQLRLGRLSYFWGAPQERLTRVDDLSSGRALTFSHNSTGQITEVVQNGGPRTVIRYTPLNLAEDVTTYNVDNSVAHTIALTYDDDFRLASAQFDNDDTQRYTFRYEPRPNLFSTKGALEARIPVMQTIPSGPGIEPIRLYHDPTKKYAYATTGGVGVNGWVLEQTDAKGTKTIQRFSTELAQNLITKTSFHFVRHSPADGTPAVESVRSISEGSTSRTSTFQTYRDAAVDSTVKSLKVSSSWIREDNFGRITQATKVSVARRQSKQALK
jgi:hypothetical protein